MQKAHPNLPLLTTLEFAFCEMCGQTGGCSAPGASPNRVAQGEQNCRQAPVGSMDVAVALHLCKVLRSRALPAAP